MSRINLFRTTVFRVFFLYAVLFSLLAAALLGFTYWSISVHIAAQINANLKTEATDLAYLFSHHNVEDLIATIGRYSVVGQSSDRYYLLISPSGLPLAGNLQAWPFQFDIRPGWHTVRLHYKEYQTRGWDREQDYSVRSYVVRLPNHYRLVVAQGLQAVQKLRDYTQGAVLGAIAMSVLASLLGGYLLARAVLRRIDTISGTAGEIMAGDLTRRVPIAGRDDEFDELAAKLNAMLERIEQLMVGMRQVTDNVAHDLRSPLTRLRNGLEVILLESRREHEYRSAIELAIEDVSVLLKTFNALLSITQAEAGVRRNDWAEVDLSALALDMAELYEAVAEDRGVQFQCQPNAGVRIYGNRHLLAQAVSNLLDNSMKYVSQGARVELRVELQQNSPVLTISDNGPGIPADQRNRVLERFVRLDSARTTPGNGLGLSLVRAVARLHGADLLLGDNAPGLLVTIKFAPFKTPSP